MAPAGATDGDEERGLAPATIALEEVAHERRGAGEERTRERRLEDEILDLAVVAAQVTKLGDVEGVFEEAHVQDPVGLDRHPVLVAEGRDRERQRTGSGATLGGDLLDSPDQLVDPHPGGVDHLRQLPDVPQERAFLRARAGQADAVVQRMRLARLAEAVKQGAVLGVEERKSTRLNSS